MKKLFLIITSLALALTFSSCNKQGAASESNTEGREVSLRPYGFQTKSAVSGTAFPQGYDMLVSAYRNLGSHPGEDTAQDYFEGIQFGYNSGVTGWKSERGPKYYPLDGTLDFLAIAGAGINSSSTGIVPTSVTWGESSNVAKKFVAVLPDNSAKFDDILYGASNAQGLSASGSPMEFKHAMTSVVFLAKCNIAYNSTTNAGITIDGITVDGAKYSGTLTVQNPSAGGGSGSLSAAWSSLGSEKEHLAARVWNAANLGTNTSETALSDFNLTSTYTSLATSKFGDAYVIMPPQTAVPFTITYTLHNGFAADGTTKLNKQMQYQYTPSGTWAMGKKNVYSLDFSLTEIIIKPTVVDWDATTASVDVPKVNALKFQNNGSTDASISLQNSGGNAPVLEYSTDGSSWTSWDYSAIAIAPEDCIYLRGNNPDGFSSSTSKYSKFVISGGSIACYGNTMTLIDYTTELTTIPSTYCFYNLFSGCTSLTSAPQLPATTLTDYCYYWMFASCTALTTASELPATTLAESCYDAMFQGCSSLTTAPDLPATTLSSDCYNSMFQYCTSLTTAPELPATTLTSNCYSFMFSSCTSLMTAPELPATTLTNDCYRSMFNGCTSLMTAPELPATTLTNNCYNSMFKGCTSLTTAPELPATTLASSCYYNMFSRCTSLTTAPELPATTLASNCYQNMFEYCTSLTTAPELPATTLASNCYFFMFYNCTQLNYIKAMFTTTPSGSYTGYWVRNVAASGTFVKNSAATWDVTGNDGIPSGWTVQTASN